MSRERAGLNIDLDESIDIEEFKSSKEDKKDILEKVAEKSGFISREPQKRIRRRKKSPFTEQIGIKTRPQIKEIFQEIGGRLDVYDHTTFELALLALLEKENATDLLDQYNKLIK